MPFGLPQPTETQYHLSNLSLADGTIVDLEVSAGMITSLHAKPRRDIGRYDASGFLALPALVDSHLHLDKTFLGCEPVDVITALDPIISAFAEEQDIRAGAAVPVIERARLLLHQALNHGTGILRTHVDIDDRARLSNFEAIMELKDEYRDYVDMQVVIFPQSGILRVPGVLGLMEEALRTGGDVVGSVDPAQVDRDPVGQLRIVFDLAQRYEKPVDIHLHDSGTLGAFQLELIAELTRRYGMSGRVAVSHAYCLTQIDPAQFSRLAELLAAAGVAIITSAPTDGTMPSVLALQAHGVKIAAGSDNVYDAWTPFGTTDLLYRASIIAQNQRLVTPEGIRTAVRMVTDDAAEVLGFHNRGLSPEAPADFMLIAVEDLTHAVLHMPSERFAFKRGRLVPGFGS